VGGCGDGTDHVDAQRVEEFFRAEIADAVGPDVRRVVDQHVGNPQGLQRTWEIRPGELDVPKGEVGFGCLKYCDSS
jgi:hypothetical protein